MIGSLFAPLAMKIAGGFAAVLLVLLGIQTWRLSNAHDAIERGRNALAQSEAQHAVTRKSLDQCATAHEIYIADGAKRRRALQRALEAQESHSAALERQIATIRAQRTEARPVEAVAGVCETAAAVLAAEGL